MFMHILFSVSQLARLASSWKRYNVFCPFPIYTLHPVLSLRYDFAVAVAVAFRFPLAFALLLFIFISCMCIVCWLSITFAFFDMLYQKVRGTVREYMYNAIWMAR